MAEGLGTADFDAAPDTLTVDVGVEEAIADDRGALANTGPILEFELCDDTLVWFCSFSSCSTSGKAVASGSASSVGDTVKNGLGPTVADVDPLGEARAALNDAISAASE